MSLSPGWGSAGVERLTATLLPGPEPPQLRQEPVGDEDVRGPAALRNRCTYPYAQLGGAVRPVHVPDVEARDLSEAEALFPVATSELPVEAHAHPER